MLSSVFALPQTVMVHSEDITDVRHAEQQQQRMLCGPTPGAVRIPDPGHPIFIRRSPGSTFAPDFASSIKKVGPNVH